MQLVIDIDENVFTRLFDNGDEGDEYVADMRRACVAICKGIPLPKGHGRLIDADTLEGHSQIQIVPCSNGKYVEVMTYYQNDIDVAPTIIEADTERRRNDTD